MVVVIALAATARAGEPVGCWTHWRGPSYQGYVEDGHVPLAWSETQNLLWKATLPGRGNSSPIVWGDRVFLTAADEKNGERWVLCVQASDGKLHWQQQAAVEKSPGRTHEWNGHASPSCTTDGTYVYAFFGTPGLFCFDFEGRLIWKHAFGVFTCKNGWGVAASPFLFEDLVIQNCDTDGPDGLPKGSDPQHAAPMALVALDKQTGKVRWQTPRDQGFGFSTPVLVPTPDGRRELVLNGQDGVWAYDPRTGREVWHCERHKGANNAKFGEPLPVFNRGTLYAASGRPGPMQAIRLGGQGDVTATHVLWDFTRAGCRDIASPILWGDSLFAGNREGFLTCQDTRDGRFVFKERAAKKSFSASPVAVRGKLLFLAEDGATFVVEPARELKITGRNVLSDGTEFRASPAVVDGRLYLRSQSHLYCIGEKK
jgi:outer membrane protein assembly factor BamB